MSIWVRRIAACGLLLGLGTILGPVAVAAFSSAMAAEEDDFRFAPSREAGRLLTAYRDRLPRAHAYKTAERSEDGGECGYDSEKVFPHRWDEMAATARENRFSYFRGYWALDIWRTQSRDAASADMVAQAICADLGEFEIGFLRRCIEATVFAPFCMKKVAAYANAVDQFDHDRPVGSVMGYGEEDRIVCTYVDGVAARRRVPLAGPSHD